MRWVENLFYMGVMINAFRIFVGNLKGRDHSKDLRMNVRILVILEWIFDGIHLALDSD